MPVPGGTLGGEPQRLRIAARDASAWARVWAGVNAFGEGGTEVVKEPVNTSNGLLVGIHDVLQVPPDLATVVTHHPSLSYYKKILTPEIISFLNSTSELTVFLPVNSAWEALPHYERLYLESKYATDDLSRIMNMHAVVRPEVKYSEFLKDGVNLTTIDGPDLKITQTEEDGKTRTKVSSANLVEPDIYASNGVIHTVDSLLIPDGTLKLTPEKYLLVLNCTSFVSLLHSVNLTSFINDTETEWTILAPRDDVLEVFGSDNIPERGSEELKKLLEYHFIPGKRLPKKLKDGMLLETSLVEEGLGGGKQVLSVDVQQQGGKEGKSVRFGGAGIIGDPVEVNNTVIYFISHPLVPPVDPLQTALPSLELSSYLAAVFSTGLGDKLKTLPRTTFLIPHNSAFKRLGMLVSAHLLAATSKPDLERVIQHHIISGVEYAAVLQNGSQRTYGTVEGSDLHVERLKDTNNTLLFTASGGWADMRSMLLPKNTLTQTGVIHEVSDVMIPRSVDLTVGKLVKAAKGTTMASMVSKAGLDWVLNGTAPPDGSRWAELGLNGEGWTLLCPTDDAFKGLNLTAIYADAESLRTIVEQHLIPYQPPSKSPNPPANFLQEGVMNNRPLVFDDGTTYTTLLRQTANSDYADYADIVFREVDKEGTVVGIKNARGKDGRKEYAHVLSWGRSTTGSGMGGVIEIDTLLMPYYPPVWVQYGGPAAVLVSGLLLIGAFFYGVRAVWRRDTTVETYEPIGGFGQEDDA